MTGERKIPRGSRGQISTIALNLSIFQKQPKGQTKLVGMSDLAHVLLVEDLALIQNNSTHLHPLI